MRCFKVDESKVTPYLTMTSSPYPHIGIGEEGRGRKYTRFPVGRRFADTFLTPVPCPEQGDVDGRDRNTDPPVCKYCGTQYRPIPEDASSIWNWKHPKDGKCPPDMARIERASVIKTKEKGTLLLVEERSQSDRRALVHLAVPAGFRGGASYTGAEEVYVPCRFRGCTGNDFVSTVDNDGYCIGCGEKLHPVDPNVYVHARKWVHSENGGESKIPTLEQMKDVTILAQGSCAQGAAGRMGGHDEYLVIMEPGATICARRGGRLYGAPNRLYIHWDGEELRLGEYDEIFPPSCEVEEGEVI